jgi:hypothetical protein
MPGKAHEMRYPGNVALGMKFGKSRSFAFKAFSLFQALALPQAAAMDLVYAPAPPDNPMRGLVPYVGKAGEGSFPHSMEFCYLSLADMMTGWGRYNWAPLEEKLAEVSKRGNQLVFRVYCEYPGKGDSIPAFLKEEAVKVTVWDAGGMVGTPDYSDPRMRRALAEFIAAAGAKYDGDPRIGFITAGMLGLWGEWHNHPRNGLWAPEATQVEVMDAFEKAFRITPVLLRYPSAGGGVRIAANAGRPFGYHDDSFGWTTLDTGKKEESWHFMAQINAAGAAEKWKTAPIGGEIRPELWKTLFTAMPHPKAQDFAECVEQSHVSWLMDSGMFAENAMADGARVTRALTEVGRMGYELHVSSASLGEGRLSLVVENRGVAPFYHSWPVEAEADGRRLDQEWEVKGILPGKAVTWSADVKGTPSTIRIRIPNPMPGGKPLRFANHGRQGQWLVLDAERL